MPGGARSSSQLRVTLAAALVLGAAAPTAVAPSPAPAAPAVVAIRAGAGAAPASENVDGPVSARAQCGAAVEPFRPTMLTIPRVVGPTRVLALGRDRNGVPRTPPLTERGKWQFAWDKARRPGNRHGVVRLNAHTYPRFAGLALGNRLLARLRVGARIVVTGAGSARLCYRVIRRVQKRAGASFADYYAMSGPPRLAILVCSGRRRGPGDWSHRTVWFAEPVQRSSN